MDIDENQESDDEPMDYPSEDISANQQAYNWLKPYSTDKSALLSSVQFEKNKPEMPEKFVNTKGRQVYSSIFAFADKMRLVSFVPKPRKTVTLLSTMHHAATIDEEDRFKRK